MLILIAAALWLIGGNLIIAVHYVRRGKPWWSGFRPWTNPWGELSRGERIALLALGAAALAVFAAAGTKE